MKLKIQCTRCVSFCTLRYIFLNRYLFNEKDDNSADSEVTGDSENHLGNKLQYERSLISSFDPACSIDNESLCLDVLSTGDDTEFCESVRKRRQNYALSANSFSVRIKELRSFQSDNLNHMIVNSPSVKKINEKSFSQFFLLSALPKDILSKIDELASMDNLICPCFCKSVNVIDRYPLTSQASHFSLEEVASVCLPSGVQFRFIPSCAKEVAKKLSLIGEEGDRYQLHTVREVLKIKSLM